MTEPGTLLQDLPATDTVWMSHGDAVTRAPEGFRVTGHHRRDPGGRMEDRERGLFAVQFHPEVSHTPRGQAVMKRFLYDGCGLLPDWTPTNIVDEQVQRIRAAGGRRRGALRALRRRRLRGRRAARPPGGRRPADLRLRRSRAEPGGRARSGRGDVRAALPRAARAREGRGPVPREARRGDRSRGQAQGDRRGVHPRVRGGRARATPARGSWCRARCTPT